MSYRFVHPVLWHCDKDGCNAAIVGVSDVLPDGWSAAVVDAKLEHYCPACSENVAETSPGVLPS